MKGLLRQALRSLCLPLSPSEENAAAGELARYFKGKSISYSESARWVKLQLGLWEDCGKAPELLEGAIAVVLDSVADKSYKVNAESYLLIHLKLQTEYRFSHSDATAFLSHIRLARELAVNHRLSAGRLTYILGQLDGRLHFSSQNVKMALQKIKYTTSVTHEQMEALFLRDRRNETSVFADADMPVGAELIAASAKELGYRGNLAADLLTLCPAPNINTHIAQLQLLHHQCTILNYYDHSTFDLYEFNPRGKTANWLFAQYPGNLAAAKNPFLNNAKSVSILGRSWVESKGRLRPAALALFNILSSLDEMSYAERREVAALIRAWIFLFLRLSGNKPVQLPATLHEAALLNLARLIAAGNTGTLGILEQRWVDTISATKFHDPEWRPRGLSDSVNATNMSKKKIGDCDFQNSTLMRIEAFESHGGKLTSTYIDEHIRTLRRVLPLRVQELNSFADVSEWQAKITFVAQFSDCVPPEDLVISGLRITFEILSVSEFSATVTGALEPFARQFFLDPLRERRTPEFVRLKLLDLLTKK